MTSTRAGGASFEAGIVLYTMRRRRDSGILILSL